MKILDRGLLASALLVLSMTSAAAQRLVTLGGEVTETVFALGLGDRVVAVDTSSTWPPEATELPQVGYVRSLAAEGVLAMAPDLVLASADAGPPQVLAKLRAAGVELLVLPGPPPVTNSLQLIETVARRLEVEVRGAELIAEIRHALAALPGSAERPAALAVIGGQGGQLMAAGAGTRADAMLRLAGARNAAAEFHGYRPLSAESLIRLNPAAIVVPDHALPLLGGLNGLRRQPGVAATTAGRTGRLVTMDGLLLLGMGPRLGLAARELATALGTAP